MTEKNVNLLPNVDRINIYADTVVSRKIIFRRFYKIIKKDFLTIVKLYLGQFLI